MKRQEENAIVKSVDDGYGRVKYDGDGNPDLIPSFVTPYQPKPKDDFTDNKSLRYISAEVDGERFLVGDYAAKLDPNIRWESADHKHSTPNFPILLKTALGMMCSGTESVVDMLMMNLPLKFDTPERRFDLVQQAMGTHRVGISTDGIYYVQKTITVENIDIKKQPFGSLCDIMLDDSGDIINMDIAKGFNVLVDVGARTLNILTVDALEEQQSLSRQDNQGLYSSYLQVGKYLEEELNAPIPDGKLPAIIQSKEIKGRDISPLIDRVFDNHANNIIATLNTVLINSWAFVNNIIYTGGGAEALKPYLEGKIQGVNTIFLGSYSNVRGLRKYGIRQAAKGSKRGGR
jgi:plasmid segregation protein ParM